MATIKKVMIIAGEASGDLHGSNLVKELKQLAPALQLIGMGGKKMEQAGVELVADVTDLSVCGLIEVVRYLPKFRALLSQIKKALITQQPDLLILIDFPTFNLKLAKTAAALNIKVLYYISPQLWAWHTSRIKKIKKYIHTMAVIFPFEANFYRQYAMPVKYVGHPLLEVLSPENLPPAADRSNCTIRIGLLPGSRKNEIKYLLPILIQSANLLNEQLPGAEFILPLANTIKKEEIVSHLQQSQVAITLVEKEHYAAMRSCNVVIAASGTVTLELALLGVPMVIAYKGNLISFEIIKRLVKIPYIGLCNIIAGKKVVEELIQYDAHPKKILAEVLRLIKDNVYRQRQKDALSIVAKKLSSEKECSAAQLALTVLQS